MSGKTITRYAIWDRPMQLETIVALAATALAIDAGYEVLHKTKLGASILPKMMNHPVHKYIKITFEEELVE